MSAILIKGPVSPALISEYISGLSKNSCVGAHSVFMGQVRSDEENGRKVIAIEYSAYDEMVEKEAKRIFDIIKNAFPDIRDIVIVHSTGLVPAGKLSLFLMVTSAHRDQAVRACSQALEMIKESYPVWKKEIFDDESHKWINH